MEEYTYSELLEDPVLGPRTPKKCLMGNEAHNPCAMCRLHHCVLTVKEMRGRQCREKQCHHLVRFRHQFWVVLDERKARRKARKAALEARYTAIVGGNVYD